MARCLMKAMVVPVTFCGEAMKTAIYLLNHVPTHSLDGLTPYEAWHKRRLVVHHLCTFGCVAHMKHLGPGIDKLVDRSTLAIFVGYEEDAKAYMAYDPSSKWVIITGDVTFEEHRRWDWMTATNRDAALPVEHLAVTYNDEYHNV